MNSNSVPSETMNSSLGVVHEGKLKKLRSDAGKGMWAEVLETYKQERELRTAEITATGDTVLHMAVFNGEEKVVANMVDLVCAEQRVDRERNERRHVLGARNDRKNTPLHLAATMGNVELCKKIAGADPSLISRLNIAGETPLFLAALAGRKKAFLWLHYLYIEASSNDNHGTSSSSIDHDGASSSTDHGSSSNNHPLWRRNNEDTILHCAIAEGHFDVAIEIVQLYKDQVKEMMRRSKEGLTPLHIVAAKRSAFESTALLGRSSIVRPIYRFFRVEEKKQAITKEELEQFERKSRVTVVRDAVVKFYRESSWSFALLTLLILPRLFIETGIWFHGMRKMKEKHTWCLQIMNELLQHASDEDMKEIVSRTPSQHLSISEETKEENESEMATPPSGTIIIETPLMTAAKNGVIEMVDKILESFPSRIKDENDEGKNVVLLAVEYRQTWVYKFLWKQKKLSESIFRKVDKQGNNALHLAARLGVEHGWLHRGKVLTMPMEINWFEYVKCTMPPCQLERYNKNMETPDDMFRESHKELMRSEGEWVASTSQACSVVSILVASVAFATRDTVPGGYDNSKGYAILRNNIVFRYFASFSFFALFFSLISTIFFLSIVASRSQSVRSWKYLPFKLYFGMCFMFVSILGLWISFCAGHFFMLNDDIQKLSMSLPCYLVVSLLIILFIVTQLPTFIGPALSSIRQFPPPKRKIIPPIVYRRTNKNKNDTDLGRDHT
ncbi:uncharacterized protein LOC129314502 [Prosopis cineraria]|uniref:uncharacterized protein LOC129314502 n=1 Tax=Prosopis cineraria TaxID=364024 RepID=UPI00240F6712|nr:uncharacterized protein LOC129314502 [Prosopis cineraria]